MKVGQILKNGRELQGLSLRQVEEVLNISNAYLSQLENGKIKSPSANYLYRLADLYRLNFEQLLKASGIIDGSLDKPKRFLELPYEVTEKEQELLLKYLKFIRKK